jgi:hypothetical protein
MSTFGGRFQVPVETYHGVPRGWSRTELLAAHRALGGVHPISGAEATEPGAPEWLPDRKNWLQYRATMYRISDGVRAHDTACIELAIRYIELRHIGSYSGFIRARLARALKGVTLSTDQVKRLNRVFISVVESHDYTEEFNSYAKLWARIASPEARSLVEATARRCALPSLRPWLRDFATETLQLNATTSYSDSARSPAPQA